MNANKAFVQFASLRIRKIILDEIERKRARIAAGYKDE